MKVNKSQLSNGIICFLQNEVVQNVPDNGLKIILGTFIFSMKRDPRILDKYLFGNAFVSMLLDEENGCYDVNALCDDVSKAIKEYGSLTFRVPSIPLLSKDEKTLSFGASDVQRLKEYIERAAEA